MFEYTAQDVDLFHLGMTPAIYEHKNIRTMALVVTPEILGSLALEFETELIYNSDGKAHFHFSAKRATEDEPSLHPRQFYIRPGDVLVMLWDEIHVFKKQDFDATFRTEELLPVYAEADVKDAEKTQIVPVTGNLYPEGEKPQGFMPPGSSQAEIDALLSLERVALPALERLEEQKQAEIEQKIGERIDAQPWMQQARAEIAEKDGGNTRGVGN